MVQLGTPANNITEILTLREKKKKKQELREDLAAMPMWKKDEIIGDS